VKLIDFDTVEEWNSTGPKSKHVLGTDQYIAPEAYEGKYSPASDIFAVGVIAYKILTGSFPYNGRLFDDKPGENWVGSPKMKEIRQKLCDARECVKTLPSGSHAWCKWRSGPRTSGVCGTMASDKLLENLHDRMRNESTAAETEWANATRVVTAARAKDDELRAEVKWRAAERTAAERAASEAESRHQMAKEALAQAEKQCMLAAAAATQKQNSLRQLAEFESAIQLQAKLAEQARAELQQIKSEDSARQQEVQTLRQDLRKLRELHDEKCQRQVEFTKEHDALAQQLEAIRAELAAAKKNNAELQTSLRQEKANREQLAAELCSTRAREQGLEGELAALRRAVSCAKTEVSLLRAKLATPPSPSVYSQPSRPAPPDPRQSGGEPEMGTGMASWSAPKAEPQMDKKKVELSASDFPPGLKIEPTSRSDILAANKPLSPEVTAAINIEPSKRKLSSTSQALPPARADDFPDTQQDDKPHVKCARFSDPGIPEPNLCPPVLSAPACQRDSSASPLHATKPSFACVGLGPSGPGRPGLSAAASILRPPELEPRAAPCKQQSAGLSGKPAATSGKRYMRTKEEVLRLARSMYSTKPTAKQLRNPPLKLYPAHVDYVLATWDRCPPGGTEAGASYRVTARPPAYTTNTNTNSGMLTSWQHVQHFLQLQNAQSSRDSLSSVRVVSSVR
ncbi:CRK6, partial [Symbiodinium microadriaticum]